MAITNSYPSIKPTNQPISSTPPKPQIHQEPQTNPSNQLPDLGLDIPEHLEEFIPERLRNDFEQTRHAGFRAFERLQRLDFILNDEIHYAAFPDDEYTVSILMSNRVNVTANDIDHAPVSRIPSADLRLRPNLNEYSEWVLDFEVLMADFIQGRLKTFYELIKYLQCSLGEHDLPRWVRQDLERFVIRTLDAMYLDMKDKVMTYLVPSYLQVLGVVFDQVVARVDGAQDMDFFHFQAFGL